MLNIKLARWKIWFGILLMSVLGLSLYFISSKYVNKSAIKQVTVQHITLARAESSNISSFYDVLGRSIAVLSQTNSIKSRSARTQDVMDSFMDQWRESGLIGGVVLTDKDGTVLYNSNVGRTPDTGASLAEREIFVHTRDLSRDGEFVVGPIVISMLGASKGQLINTVASPVFQNGAFAGALIASVKVVSLSERYLELMKISDSTEVYLVAAGGNTVYNISHEGSFELNGDPEVTNQLKKAYTVGQEGSIQTKDSLIVYSPVNLVNRQWLLVMDVPVQSINSITTPIRIRQVASLLLISLTFLLLGIVSNRKD